jgi:hypothetical protein
VFGDSPWAGLIRWSPEQAELYFANREAPAFNSSIVSLIGAPDNGGPGEDGRMFDGILPFDRGAIARWNEPHWQRVDEYVRLARAHGNTLFLYPIDGWNVSNVFQGATLDVACRYGAMVAERYARFPNIVLGRVGAHLADPARCAGSWSAACRPWGVRARQSGRRHEREKSVARRRRGGRQEPIR